MDNSRLYWTELDRVADDIEAWQKTPMGEYVMRSLNGLIEDLNQAADVDSIPPEQALRTYEAARGVRKALEVFEYPVRMKREGVIADQLKDLSTTTDS